LYEIGDPLPIRRLHTALLVARGVGFQHFRLTGGEPLLQRDRLAGILSVLPESAEVHLTTNGATLRRDASWLAGAGSLSLVKVSLDAVDPLVYRGITGVDVCGDVLDGILCARAEGLPVRVNTVVSSLNADHLWALLRWCEVHRLNVKLFDVNFYDHPGLTAWQKLYVPLKKIRLRLLSEASSANVTYGVGGYGIPMTEVVWGSIRITIKDSSVGTTYAPVCDGCSYRWLPGAKNYCQEALYNLTLTVDGKLIICRHRADLAVRLPVESNDAPTVRHAFVRVLSHYQAARLVLHEGETL
jgi:molybdenum cofactor biosynthesis enzyme MoaA